MSRRDPKCWNCSARPSDDWYPYCEKCGPKERDARQEREAASEREQLLEEMLEWFKNEKLIGRIQ